MAVPMSSIGAVVKSEKVAHHGHKPYILLPIKSRIMKSKLKRSKRRIPYGDIVGFGHTFVIEVA